MKLKTKLILAFMIVMILPTLFTTVAMTAFAPKAVNDIQELYPIIVFCTASAPIFWIYRTVSPAACKTAGSGPAISKRAIWILKLRMRLMMKSDSSVRILKRCV